MDFLSGYSLSLQLMVKSYDIFEYYDPIPHLKLPQNLFTRDARVVVTLISAYGPWERIHLRFIYLPRRPSLLLFLYCFKDTILSEVLSVLTRSLG